MSKNIVFALSLIGILIGLGSAVFFGMARAPQPPVFKPVSNPYPTAIYASGIVESEQAGGSNIILFPEVGGVVTRVLVHEGQAVTAGQVMLEIDDTVQRATTEQLRLQAEGARVALEALQAQPRAETLAVAAAQLAEAGAALTAVRDQYDKRRAAAALDARALSKDVLDSAADAAAQAQTAVDVAERQFQLVRAGAWRYDIRAQQKQLASLAQAYAAARALLAKYAIHARVAGVVLAINTTVGSYVSATGAFDAYTQAVGPVVVMSSPQEYLAVRCYVDEILASRLPAAGHIQAQVAIRGTDVKVPLEFVRVQPYVSPKIELSNQRQEKVDLRVLPVIFRFRTASLHAIYPGQLVDVFIGPR